MDRFYLTLEMKDSEVISRIARLRDELFSGGSIEDLYAAIASLGDDLLEDVIHVGKAGDDWERYADLCALYTWNRYSRILVKEAEDREARFPNWEMILAAQPEYAELIERSDILIEDNRRFLERTNRTYRGIFDVEG
jgi:hypothetical protein